MGISRCHGEGGRGGDRSGGGGINLPSFFF